MHHRTTQLFLALAASLALSPSAFGQVQIYNPIAASPYGRPVLSPYLNLSTSGTAASTFYGGVLGETYLRNQLVRPLVFGPDFVAFDPTRTPTYQAVAGYQNTAEDWVNARIRETQLSPSGHPTGFLMASPYYRVPNQRSFIPYNPNTNQPTQPPLRP
jgi:hypothetical protein